MPPTTIDTPEPRSRRAPGGPEPRSRRTPGGPAPRSPRTPGGPEPRSRRTPGGTELRLRPVLAGDLDALVRLHRRLSPDTLRLIYLTPSPQLSPGRIGRLTDVDGPGRAALVALPGPEGEDEDDELIGIVRYELAGTSGAADVMVVVDDAFRGADVEATLLEELAALAAAEGIERLVLEVDPRDRQLIEALDRSALRTNRHLLHCGTVQVTVPVDPDMTGTVPTGHRLCRPATPAARRVVDKMTVAAAMRADPVTVPGGVTVEQFVDDYLIPQRCAAFPVTGRDGEAIGLLTLDAIHAVPQAARARTCVDALAASLADTPTARPDEPLADLLERAEGADAERALVLQGRYVVGVVTAADVVRLARGD
ncbi:MAG TPA: CBS domain-containing protein [Acidimicrobiales bacterium]|nr:CBS domain-containing protein [Acidimicrobiales bacterium]